MLFGKFNQRPGSAPAGRLIQGTQRCSWRDRSSSLSGGRAGCELVWSRAARSVASPRAVAPALVR